MNSLVQRLVRAGPAGVARAVRRRALQPGGRAVISPLYLQVLCNAADIGPNISLRFILTLDRPRMIDRIVHDGQELALILRREYRAEGITFLTEGSYSQQLGYMNRPAGYVIPPHVHNPVVREVQYTKEVLFIRSGRLRVDFYGDDQRYLESTVLEAGDIILLALGGHGFTMLEPTEIVEVKQGPYVGDQDKTRFAGVAPEQLKMRGAPEEGQSP